MRNHHRLTASKVKALISNPPTKPTYDHDGGGLYLQRTPAGTASWLYRYSYVLPTPPGAKKKKKEHSIGLGAARVVTLAEARGKADEYRKLRAGGVDPKSQKHGARARTQREADQRITFSDAAARYIALRKPEWSASNLTAWEGSIRKHATPLHSMIVRDIATTDVLRVIEPLWASRHATAVALRQRLEAILAWATSHGYRTGENPAKFDRHLENLLTRPKARTSHRAALAYTDMPAFMEKLRAQAGNTARLLEFLVLTGARLSEGTGAVWAEIDLAGRVWHLPPERMKSKAPHDVPLSDQAIALLEALPGEHRPEDRLFDSVKGKEIAGTVARDMLRDLGYTREELTVHGFRSALRTWLGECTSAPDKVAEACLAHDRRGKLVQSYERTRFYDERVPLMDQWAHYLEGGGTTVLPLERARAKRSAA
ncbi:integrase [Paraburkholderia youngii]|uniref:tyrosine-type recombinase/integrase n=1 Tax=Paraburkholderia youngii TaxID=2782701 RepID=UPI003D1FD0A5